MRPLVHLHPRGEDALAGSAQQEARLAVLCAAADRANEMPDEAACHFRREQHRCPSRGDPPRAEPGHGALAGDAADVRSRREIAPIARALVPVVALHLAILARQQHATERMAGGAVAGKETVAVAIDAYPALRADARPLGVVDARIDGATRCLAFTRQRHRRLRSDVPREIKFERQRFAGEQRGIGEASAFVLGRMARERTGLGDGGAYRIGGEVGGARRTFALPEIDCDTQPAVALVLDRLDFTEPHRDRQALLQAGIDLGLRGPEPACLIERPCDHSLQGGNPVRIDLLRHVRIVAVAALWSREHADDASRIPMGRDRHA